MTSIAADAREGVHGLLAADSALVALLANGSADSIIYGWPAALIDPPYEDSGVFPIITYRVSFARNMRPGAGPWTIVIDEWVWPSGTTGKIDRLDAIDTRVEIVLEETGFVVSGRRGKVTDMDVRDWDTDPAAPLRRTRSVRGGF